MRGNNGMQTTTPVPAADLTFAAYFAGEGACFTSTVTAPATPGLTVNTWPPRVS